MASSESDIINIALIELGQLSPGLAEGNPIYDALRLRFPDVRDSVLRSYRWNFCTKLGFLPSSASSPSPINPDFNFPYAYDLPADFITNIGTPNQYQNLSNYGIGRFDQATKIVGRQIVSNVEQEDVNGNTGLHTYYIWRNTDVSSWDALFVELMALELALTSSFAINNNPALLSIIGAKRQDLTRKARVANSLENSPQTYESQSGWLEAHYGSYPNGLGPDNYYGVVFQGRGGRSGTIIPAIHHRFFTGIDTDQDINNGIQGVREYDTNEVVIPGWESGNRYLLIGHVVGRPDITRITTGGVNVINAWEKVTGTTTETNSAGQEFSVQWWRTKNPQNTNASGATYGVIS